jgi:3-oxoacyl-[acyl-carrier protein] reductase
LDVLVNNAASLGPVGAAQDCDWTVWQAAIKVDLLAPVELCMQAIPLMRAGGSIVNLSGGGATGPRPRFSAYATAKAVLVRFSETLAAELQTSRISVNCVAPGVMNTGLLREVAEAGPERAGDFEFTRALEHNPEDACTKAAELVAWLASAAAAGITGRLISAVWDNWKELARRAPELAASDIYTLRRIVPNDRGREWN